MSGRISWDAYFLELASVAAKRSTCLRRQVGAIIVKDKNVIATGYNGSPKNHKNCCDIGVCARNTLGIASGTQLDMCQAVHAELNAVAQAAKHGHSTEGATMYVTVQPCNECAKAIIGAGIDIVVYGDKYPHSTSDQLFKQSGVRIIHKGEK